MQGRRVSAIASVPEHEHSDRLEIISQFTAGAAHDIRNTAAVIFGYSDVALRELKPNSPGYRAVEAMAAAAKRITEECRQLLAFTPLYSPQPQLVDLNALLKSEERNLSDLLKVRLPNARLSLSYEPGLRRVKADPGLLARALGNLVVNARAAMQNMSRVPLVTIQTKEMASGISIYVIDNGCGMNDEALKQSLSDEHFTTKKGHHGLGLKVVRDVMKSAGGFMTARTVPGRGTAFELWLPAAGTNLP